MQLPLLDPRLERLRGLLPPRLPRLIDVGTDHAYLPIHAVWAGQAETALALDCRPGPLGRAEQNIRRFGCSDRIALLHSNGLCGVACRPTDWVVIAGMGGLEMADILRAADLPDGLSAVLQPMKSAAELRLSLPGLGFALADEQLAASRGRYYPILTVRRAAGAAGGGLGQPSDLPSDLSARVGPLLMQPDRRDAVTAALWPGYCRIRGQQARQLYQKTQDALWLAAARYYEAQPDAHSQEYSEHDID